MNMNGLENIKAVVPSVMSNKGGYSKAGSLFLCFLAVVAEGGSTSMYSWVQVIIQEVA